MYHQDSTNRIDTPHKRVKPNENSTVQHSNVVPSSKSSLLNKLMNGSLKPSKEQKQPFSVEVSQFELPFEYRSYPNLGSEQKMDEEEQLNQISNKVILSRRLTCMGQQPNYNEELPNTLNLYRNNSTFDQVRTIQDVKLGDNIYLRPINSQVESRKDTRYQQHHGEEHGSRIDQDYQIQKNLKLHGRHHQNYICLNKLERIFYYVKKVIITWEQQQNYQSAHRLVSNQIKIYNKDQKGHFIRFYQSWLQQNALFITYQVAAQSLEELTRAHNRLREVEAWDLLRDAAQALKWLSQTMNLSHLNIKPGNILKCQRKYKLADQYTDPSILQTYLRQQQTKWKGWPYLAPQIRNYYELIEGLDLKKSDIYSLGMCLIENLLGDKYFPREGRALRIHMQKHMHTYSPALTKVLQRMVNLDPAKRPTAAELCQIGRKNEDTKVVDRRSLSI